MSTEEKKTPTRIYAVSSDQLQTTRLVRASSQAQALHHVTTNDYRICVASQDQLESLLTHGTKVETAGA